MNTKDSLIQLVDRFQQLKTDGGLNKSSEATMRAWIDELLAIFGWDVQNTHQVLTEHTLGKDERQRLHDIGSTNTRPDYTLVNGNVALAFVDAKSLDVDIKNDKSVAFQIRSYGWSVGAQYSIVTNFDTLAIYDCQCMPRVDDDANVARLHFYDSTEYVDNYEILHMFLLRENIITKKLKYSHSEQESLDYNFSRFLGEIRIKLAESIIRNNRFEDLDLVSSFVQTIINRILFIRVCESKGLEKEGLLLDYMNDDFWTRFKNSSYFEFYEHYDGPMFNRINHLQSLVVDNDTLGDFVSKLYYPSPYRFDVIPVKTLSDIYDLFLGYRLVLNNGVVSDQLKEEFKKSNGAVTTPEMLVHKVIECTMPTDVIDSMSITELLNLKIADIACGSGVFLVGAYDFLASQVIKKITEGQVFDNRLAIIKDHPMLTIEGRRAIINSCIYGVDINPEAVDVAKMSLSLKMIDDYNSLDFEDVGLLGSQILHGVGNNIKCGNSLVGSDIEQKYPALSENFIELQATNSFDWRNSYPEVFANGGFDIILGNPPYVEVKNYNVSLPHMAMYIKDTFVSSRNGKIDLAIPFIEQGMRLLNETGRLGYIIQKRFFKTDYGKGIRKLLTDNKTLHSIYDFEETDLFKGRITYVAIMVCDSNKDNNAQVKYESSATDHVEYMPCDVLSATPWNFENVRLNAIRNHLTNSIGTLADVCNVKVGLQVLWNNAFQIIADSVADGLIYGHSAIDENICVELDACKPLICNEHFAPLTKRDYTTYALFPYEVSDNGDVTELSMSDMAATYPRATEYLNRHKNQILDAVESLPQKNGNYNINDHWHLFTRANNHGAVYQKIVVPMTAQYPQAAVITDTHVYCDNANMFFIQVPNGTEDQLYALSAIISSTIFNTLARSIANPQQGGYFKFNKQFLNPVPVPKDAFLNETADIKQLAIIARRIETLNQQIKNSNGMRIGGLVNSLNSSWAQLDSLCDRLYNITDEERQELYAVVRNDRNPYGQDN